MNPGAILEVSTRFYICEDNTLLLDKSRMNINHSVTIVSGRSEIDSYGDIYIRNGATLHLKADSRLILHDLSKLYIEDGGKLIIDEGALVEFYNGARIYTLGANSEIQLYGQIVTKNAAAFTIIPSGAAAGKFRVFTINESFAADAPSTFTLVGKGINDPFVFIEEGKRLFVSDPDISALNINNCKTTFKLNSKLESRQPFYSSYAQFTSTVSNNGFFFTDITNLSNSIFINTNIDKNGIGKKYCWKN